MSNKMMAAAIAAAMGLAALSSTAGAASGPVTATFQVLMKINKACTVTAGAGSNIQLGAAGGVDATAAVGTTGSNSFTVNCSNTTPYYMALQSGNNASTAGLGTLKGATAGNTDTLTYQLCSDSTSCATVWGNNGVTNTTVGNGKSGTGNGAAQTQTVYAKVTGAAPALVTPDNYSDTVTVSVYF